MDSRDTSINVARSCSCIRLLSRRVLLEAGKRGPERESFLRVAFRASASPLPPLCECLAEFLSLLATSRRLITPRRPPRKYSCTFMARAYVKFQCRCTPPSFLLFLSLSLSLFFFRSCVYSFFNTRLCKNRPFVFAVRILKTPAESQLAYRISHRE